MQPTKYCIDVDKFLDALLVLVLAGWEITGDVGREFREMGFQRLRF